MLAKLVATTTTTYIYDPGSNEICPIEDRDVPVLRRMIAGESEQSVLADSPDRERDTALVEAIRAKRRDGWFPDIGPRVVMPCDDCYNPKSFESDINILQLCVTENCNFRCTYCPYTYGTGGYRAHTADAMTWPTARQAIDFYAERSHGSDLPTVTFYGGEPTTVGGLLVKIARYIRENHDHIGNIMIDTNGYDLTPDLILALKPYRIAYQISFDGPAHAHDRYRRTANGEKTHRRILKNLAYLRDLDENALEATRMSCVVAPPNSLIEAVEYFSSNPFELTGDKVLPANLILPTLPEESECRDWSTDEYWDQLRRELSDLRQRFLAHCNDKSRYRIEDNLFEQGVVRIFHRPRMKLPEEMFPTASCVPGLRKLFVKPNGDLLPCERVGDDMVIGSVSDGFDHAKIKRLYASMVAALESRCPSCWAQRLCGLCFAALGSTISRAKPEISELLCEQVRGQICQDLQTYCELFERGDEYVDWLKETSLV
jgi:uncharacterized protein